MTNSITTTKKITFATLKSFVKKNSEALYIATLKSFDGYSDCVDHCENKNFKKVVFGKSSSCGDDHVIFSINGAFFCRGTGRSSDSLSTFDNGEFVGFSIWNCCGEFVLAIKK